MMEPIYRKTFCVPATATDRFDRIKPSQILALLQDAAGDHCALLGADWDTLAGRNLFWAVIRHRVEVTRLPRSGEEVTVETWPMPTTRTAYPRATVVYDGEGRELLRGISLWVLMDRGTRAMILPGKSGVHVEGHLRGSELAVPGSLLPRSFSNTESRTVRYTELDVNGHMNNCRYLDWAEDLLPSRFHQDHAPKEFTVCYLSEARETETVELSWELDGDGVLNLDGHRREAEPSMGHSRVFSVRMRY